LHYRPEVDGLRAVAVVPVVLFHAGSGLFAGGFIGVDVFFVISGYLITSIILEDVEAGTFSFRRFYERRARRILPALLLVCLVCIPIAWVVLLPHQLQEFAESLVAVVTFTSNIIFWQQSGYFATSAELNPLLHTWSLAVEEQYYLLFPLLVVLCCKSDGRKLRTVLIAIAAVSLLAAHLMTVLDARSAAFYLLITRFWELAAGALTSMYLRSKPPQHQPSNIWSLVGLVAVCASFFWFDRYTLHPGLYTLFPVVGSVLVIVFAGPGTLVHSVLASRLLVAIGLISYSLYLWHQPMFAFARYWLADDPSTVVMAVLVMLSACLAFLSWRFVEQPFRTSEAISARTAVGSLLAGSLLIGGIGVYWILQDGRAGRWYQDAAFLDRYQMVRQLRRERFANIRAGECHFNGRGKHRKIDEFIQKWSCAPNDEAGLNSSRIGVFGDSHSADKAVALRLNGIDTMQIGGAGCPLLPPENGAGRCAKLVELFHEKAAVYDLSTVVLANFYSGRELTPDYLKQVLEYWSTRYRRVFVFSPMPRYGRWRESFLRTSKPSFEVDRSADRKFFEAVKQLDVPANARIINTAQIFCAAWPECDFGKSGKYPLTDYGHSSAYGARVFGETLLLTTDVLGQ